MKKSAGISSIVIKRGNAIMLLSPMSRDAARDAMAKMDISLGTRKSADSSSLGRQNFDGHFLLVSSREYYNSALGGLFLTRHKLKKISSIT
jgi:hypothetical protein